MNMKRIETFYWVVRLGSFRAAADRLSTTQSTVSMRVMQLEKEIGASSEVRKKTMKYGEKNISQEPDATGHHAERLGIPRRMVFMGGTRGQWAPGVLASDDHDSGLASTAIIGNVLVSRAIRATVSTRVA